MSQQTVLKDHFPKVPTAIDVPVRIDAIRLAIPRNSVNLRRLKQFINNHPNFDIKNTPHYVQIIVHGEFLYLVNDIASFLRALVTLLFFQRIFTISSLLEALLAVTLDPDLLFTHVGITRLELTFDLRPDQFILTPHITFLLAYRSIYSSDHWEGHRSTIIFYDLARKYLEKGQTSKAFLAALTRPYRLEFRLYGRVPFLCIDNLSGTSTDIVERFQFLLSRQWHDLEFDKILRLQNLEGDQETLFTMTRYIFSGKKFGLRSKRTWNRDLIAQNKERADTITQALTTLGIPQSSSLDDGMLWSLFLQLKEAM